MQPQVSLHNAKTHFLRLFSSACVVRGGVDLEELEATMNLLQLDALSPVPSTEFFETGSLRF